MPSDAKADKAGKRPFVLIVEDNQRQSELIASIIEETGLYQILTAGNGEEAIKRLAEYERGFDFLSNKISCILLDWQMPKMHGEAFLRQLREKEKRSPYGIASCSSRTKDR